MKRFIVVLALLAVSVFGRSQSVDTLRVSSLYTTHIIFSTDLIYADLSNTKLIAAKIVEQNRNMFAMMAKGEFPGSCSVSALESNGAMHTFIVVYDEHPDRLVIDLRPDQGGKVSSSDSLKQVKKKGLFGAAGTGNNVSTWKSGRAPLLSEMIQEPQHIYHVGCKQYDVVALCEDVSFFNDITYFIISLKNNSGISYNVSNAAFCIESKRKSKRSVNYNDSLVPRSQYGTLNTSPGDYSRIVYSFDKITLSKDQVLKIYLYEEGGQRNLALTLNTQDINKARTVK